MKNVFCLLGSFFWVACAQAAMVTLGTPSGSQESYFYVDKEYDVFANITSGAAFGSNDGGEELIWLGAHESWPVPIDKNPGDIAVNLTKAAGVDATAGVSLVLSSALPIDWFVSVADGVQLNNVFIISNGAEPHKVRVNNAQSNLLPGTGATLGGVNVLRSDTTTACGFELPSSNEGCNTEKTLGLEEIVPGTGIFYDNVLATMQGTMPGESPLQLTSFNGTYYVNQFDVEIDSVIPLPASAFMFGSALAALLVLRRRTGSPPITI